MTSVCEIFQALCRIAPPELQMDFDNSGCQLGRMGREVHRVLLALDATDEVVEEAAACGAELIITHHPLLFSPLSAICDSEPVQRRVLTLIEHGIALISMHTNLDIAEGGVNDVLIRLLGAEPEGVLDSDGCGRIGTLSETMELKEFLTRCRDTLRVNGLRYCDAGKDVRKIAVMGGSGGGSVEAAAGKGCDTYVTADVKYHQFQRALELGLNLIDADHFCTENPVIPVLADKLGTQFPDVCFTVSERHGPCIRFA